MHRLAHTSKLKSRKHVRRGGAQEAEEGRQEEGGECLQIEQTEQCPDGWKAIGGKCYMASTEKATWEEANRTCSSLGGKLVEPLNSQEDGDVAAFMEERYGSQRYWIGLSDQVEESK